MPSSRLSLTASMSRLSRYCLGSFVGARPSPADKPNCCVSQWCLMKPFMPSSGSNNGIGSISGLDTGSGFKSKVLRDSGPLITPAPSASCPETSFVGCRGSDSFSSGWPSFGESPAAAADSLIGCWAGPCWDVDLVGCEAHAVVPI